MDSSLSRRSSGHGGLSPARLHASHALRLVQEKGAYAQAAIEREVDSTSLSQEDKRFASALVLGVVRTQGVLDTVLDSFLDKPARVRPDTRRALQIAAYEILFLDKEAHHAVNQGVLLVGKSAPYAKGLANAVLRRVAQEREEIFSGQADSYLATLCLQEGFPKPLAALIEADRGPQFARRAVADASHRPPVFLHASALKAERAAVASSLEDASVAFTQIEEIPGCIRLEDPSAVAREPVRSLIEEGVLIVSDLAAQLVAYSCVREGLPESFLEVGAGRGTKTVLIQSMAQALFGSQIKRYVCVDNVAFKRQVLLDRVGICGAKVSECITSDGRSLEDALPGQAFQRVFLDAPCSGLGTLRRHPEIIWKASADDIERLACLQSELLQSASQLVALNGSLIYSTCTITVAENEASIESFLASPAGSAFAWESGFMTASDGQGADCHFLASLKRLA